MKAPNAPPIPPERKSIIIKPIASNRFSQLYIKLVEDVVVCVDAILETELNAFANDAIIAINMNIKIPRTKPVIIRINKLKKTPLIYPSLVYLAHNMPVTIDPKNAMAKRTIPA